MSNLENFTQVVGYIPKKVEDRCSRKHQNNNDWVNIHYYINKTRYQVPRLEVTSKQPYKINTMYKISNLSKGNNCWDYYKILKPHIKPDETKNIMLENKLKSGSIKGVKTYKADFRHDKCVVYFD